MSSRLSHHSASARPTHLFITLLLGCASLFTLHTSAHATPPPAPQETLPKDAWLPSPETLHTIIELLSALSPDRWDAAASDDATRVTAERCIMRDARPVSCEGLTLTRDEGLLTVAQVQYDAQGHPIALRGVTMRASAEAPADLTAQEILLTPGGHTPSSPSAVLSQLTLRAPQSALTLSAKTLSIQQLENEDTLHVATFEAPSWGDVSGGAAQVTAQRARWEASRWEVSALHYSPLLKRAKSDSEAPALRGLLSPLVSVTTDESPMLGQEVAIAAPHNHALLAGVLLLPPRTVGLSLGVVSLSEGKYGAPSAPPLRFRYARQFDAEEASPSWSLIGPLPTLTLTSHIQLDGRFEEGDASHFQRAALEQDAALRTWRQSRVGLSLGGPEHTLQLSGVHDPLTRAWELLALLGARVPLTERASADLVLRHDSSIAPQPEDDIDTLHRHRSEASPGILIALGKRSTRYVELFPSLLISYESSRQPEQLGGATASRTAVALEASAGLSLQGRFARMTHQLDPRLTLLYMPIDAAQRTAQTQQVSTTTWGAALLSLDQGMRPRGSAPRVGLRMPLSLMAHSAKLTFTPGDVGLLGWGEVEGFFSPREAHLSFEAALTGCRSLGGGVTPCVASQWGARLGASWRERLGVRYGVSTLGREQMMWRWLLGGRSGGVGSAEVLLWSDVHAALMEQETRSVARAHAIEAFWQRGTAAQRLWVTGFLEERVGGEWGARARYVHRLSMMNWDIILDAGYRAGEDDERRAGISLSWAR